MTEIYALFALLFVLTAQLDFGDHPLLDTEVAQEIAEKLTELIDYNVLLANEKRIIVGSSELGRVGAFHEPSIEAIKKKITTIQSSTVHLHTTKQSKGAKPGLTLALILGDEVVRGP